MAAGLQIDLLNEKGAYSPGDLIEGVVSWNLSDRPKAVKLHLLFFTRGKGDQDVIVADTIEYDSPPAVGVEKFTFASPPGPYTFSGKLISLIWALELETVKPDDAFRREITIAPGAQEILLSRISNPVQDDDLFSQKLPLNG